MRIKTFALTLLLFFCITLATSACGDEEKESISMPANSNNLVTIKVGDQVRVNISEYDYSGDVVFELQVDGTFKKIAGPSPQRGDDTVILEGLAPGTGLVKWDGLFLLHLVVSSPNTYDVGTFGASAQITKK